jgi:beta-aspartyl-peptidase (threonine type)
VTQVPVIVVHGGAGTLDAERRSGAGAEAHAAALARAVEAGRSVLQRDGGAHEAVVEAVVVLEDDPGFNAGRGAVPCSNGSLELSASLMDGRTRRVGAMVGLRRTRHPVRAAATLLDHAHGLLFGEQADLFASRAGLERVPPDFFWTEQRRRQWRERRAAADSPSGPDRPPETVGAVALDRSGGLAAATSTGGVLGQLAGRVGDSPVVGAGTWADLLCAVSATGDGDVFLRAAFARRLADLVELAGLDVQGAARRALDEVNELGGLGGCIALDARGRIAAPYTTAHMPHAWARGAEPPRVRLASGLVSPARAD